MDKIWAQQKRSTIGLAAIIWSHVIFDFQHRKNGKKRLETINFQIWIQTAVESCSLNFIFDKFKQHVVDFSPEAWLIFGIWPSGVILHFHGKLRSFNVRNRSPFSKTGVRQIEFYCPRICVHETLLTVILCVGENFWEHFQLQYSWIFKFHVSSVKFKNSVS